MAARRGRTSPRTFRTCRRGARSATLRHRVTTPAPLTSPSIFTRSTIATRLFTRPQITDGIARSMLSCAHCVREDPTRAGLLYLGTENALYVSFDDGDNWQPLQANLPHAPVYWIVIQDRKSTRLNSSHT